MIETAITINHACDEASIGGEQVAGSTKYLLFNIGDSLFGIAMAGVSGIVETREIDEVSGSSDFICGLMDHHGQIIPLVDIGYQFGPDKRGNNDRFCVIISNVDDMTIGIIVDAALETCDIEQKHIDSRNELQGIPGDLPGVSGLAYVKQHVVTLIDLCRLLQWTEQRPANYLE